MRIFIMRLSLMLIVLVLTPTLLSAQTESRTELGVGYSLMRIVEGRGQTMPVGWFVSVARPTTKWFSIVGEVAGNYKFYNPGETDAIHSFQGGVRVGVRRASAGITPFGQFLLGGTHLRSKDNSDVITRKWFSIEPGAGMDVPVKGRMSARLAVGFPMFFDSLMTINNVRLEAGVVFPLGK